MKFLNPYLILKRIKTPYFVDLATVTLTELRELSSFMQNITAYASVVLSLFPDFLLVFYLIQHYTGCFNKIYPISLLNFEKL